MSSLLECDYPDCDGEFHLCFVCDGEGSVMADCGEDSCCCLVPEVEHGRVRCGNCLGTGGWKCRI